MNALGWWFVKTAGSIALSAPLIWGGAYWLSDYVSDKYARGLTTAVEGLQTSVSDLNQTVTAINTNLSQQLIELERQRAELAIEIAREVQKLQGEQGLQKRDIDYLRESLDELKRSVRQINDNTQIRFTTDGGKTFDTLTTDEALTKFGPPATEAGFIIAPWSYQAFDPATGRLEDLKQ